MSSELDDQTFRKSLSGYHGLPAHIAWAEATQKKLRQSLEEVIRRHRGRDAQSVEEPDMNRNRHDLTSAERKQMPVQRGCMQYFPDALLCLSMLSSRADAKHTPGADPSDMSRPQWVKGKSADHGDCLVRHQMDKEDMDPELGLMFMIHVFWRAGAQLQEYIDTHGIDAVIDWDWVSPHVSEDDDIVPELRDAAQKAFDQYLEHTEPKPDSLSRTVENSAAVVPDTEGVAKRSEN